MARVKLADAFILQMGKTPSREEPQYWDGNFPWVAISDMGKGKYICKTKETISQKGIKESGIKIVPKNTVIMSFKLSIGKTAITSDDMYTNEAIMALINKKIYNINVDYIYHALSSVDWDKNGNRAVMGVTLNKATLSNIEIPLPEIDEQCHIAKVLDKLDSIIETRKNQLTKLDQLVKARFVEMFGDPVENPKNWPTKSIRDASQRISDGPFGSNLKSEHYTPSGIRVIRLQNIGVSQFVDIDSSYISHDHYEKIKKYTCHAGDIVIGTLGVPNLRACIIPTYIEKAINKADCVRFVPDKSTLNPVFACYYINQPATLSLAEGSIHGQTRSRISMSQVASLPIFLPPLPLQEEFADFVQRVDKSKSVVKQSLEKLETLKKSLMQEYFG